eukprot:scaffold48684_cov34-Prasinocladus_malaysianus.AAC.1
MPCRVCCIYTGDDDIEKVHSICTGSLRTPRNKHGGRQNRQHDTNSFSAVTALLSPAWAAVGACRFDRRCGAYWRGSNTLSMQQQIDGVDHGYCLSLWISAPVIYRQPRYCDAQTRLVGAY